MYQPHEELLKMNKDLLMSVIQAQEYLEKQRYVPPDMQGCKAMLSYTLLLLVHCTPPNIFPKAIRAVVMLLEHEEAG